MHTATDSALLLEALDVAIPGTVLVKQLDLVIQPGERLAIMGRNGAGKSLTLRTMAGLRAPASGTVTLEGTPLVSLERRSIARRLALLPQEALHDFPELAIERVLSGRHPHIDRWQWESQSDIEIARAALETMGIAALAGRDTASLSGGEQQRLALAQILVQQPVFYLLDEPTNHLDLRHQHLVLDHFGNLAKKGAAIVMSLHDVNLAAKFADRFLLLFGDGSWLYGDARTALTESSLTRLLDIPVTTISNSHGQSAFVAGSVH